jgi:hypothetical protein
MSVTVHIANDTDKSVVERYDCQRCSYDGKVSPDCPECQGKGEVVFTSSKWQINLANGNFHTVFSALGLSTECYGEIDGRTLAKAIKAYIPGLAERAEVQERCGALLPGKGDEREGALHIFCGLSGDQVDARLARLLEIAEEAARREEKVIWG